MTEDMQIAKYDDENRRLKDLNRKILLENERLKATLQAIACTDAYSRDEVTAMANATLDLCIEWEQTNA